MHCYFAFEIFQCGIWLIMQFYFGNLVFHIFVEVDVALTVPISRQACILDLDVALTKPILYIRSRVRVAPMPSINFDAKVNLSLASSLRFSGLDFSGSTDAVLVGNKGLRCVFTNLWVMTEKPIRSKPLLSKSGRPFLKSLCKAAEGCFSHL